MLSDDIKNKLLLIAKESIIHAWKKQSYRPNKPHEKQLLENNGVFITLKADNALRGCLGCFTSDEPLYLLVAKYTKLTLLDDPRFENNRLTPAEDKKINIEISVISALKNCQKPENINLGKDGIYIKHKNKSGCFLPQVAIATGWNIEEFWGHCAKDKAGLSWDSWKNDDCQKLTFNCEVINADYKDIKI